MECLKFISFSDFRTWGFLFLEEPLGRVSSWLPEQCLMPWNTKSGQIYTEQKLSFHPSNSSQKALGIFLCSRPPECFSRLHGWAAVYGSSTNIVTVFDPAVKCALFSYCAHTVEQRCLMLNLMQIWRWVLHVKKTYFICTLVLETVFMLFFYFF